MILNALLRDGDGRPLAEQPVKLEVVQPDGQVISSRMSQPVNGLYQFTWPLDAGAPTGMWHIRASTGDNQPREWDFHVEDFMPERMALNLSGQKGAVAPNADVTFARRRGLSIRRACQRQSAAGETVPAPAARCRLPRCRASSLAILLKKTSPAASMKSR
ncbi:MG2 domain [Raoultella terrigena]|uniref:MG2 domain n=1 Tax=Raoultella terrigena TaxID=577 RepID=A0A4U9D565_RAOTE|nr:MG2 domain [Raoultella terrigena]